MKPACKTLAASTKAFVKLANAESKEWTQEARVTIGGRWASNVAKRVAARPPWVLAFGGLAVLVVMFGTGGAIAGIVAAVNNNNDPSSPSPSSLPPPPFPPPPPYPPDRAPCPPPPSPPLPPLPPPLPPLPPQVPPPAPPPIPVEFTNVDLSFAHPPGQLLYNTGTWSRDWTKEIASTGRYITTSTGANSYKGITFRAVKTQSSSAPPAPPALRSNCHTLVGFTANNYTSSRESLGLDYSFHTLREGDGWWKTTGSVQQVVRRDWNETTVFLLRIKDNKVQWIVDNAVIKDTTLNAAQGPWKVVVVMIDSHCDLRDIHWVE